MRKSQMMIIATIVSLIVTITLALIIMKYISKSNTEMKENVQELRKFVTNTNTLIDNSYYFSILPLSNKKLFNWQKDLVEEKNIMLLLYYDDIFYKFIDMFPSSRFYVYPLNALYILDPKDKYSIVLPSNMNGEFQLRNNLLYYDLSKALNEAKTLQLPITFDSNGRYVLSMFNPIALLYTDDYIDVRGMIIVKPLTIVVPVANVFISATGMDTVKLSVSEDESYICSNIDKKCRRVLNGNVVDEKNFTFNDVIDIIIHKNEVEFFNGTDIIKMKSKGYRKFNIMFGSMQNNEVKLNEFVTSLDDIIYYYCVPLSNGERYCFKRELDINKVRSYYDPDFKLSKLNSINLTMYSEKTASIPVGFIVTNVLSYKRSSYQYDGVRSSDGDEIRYKNAVIVSPKKFVELMTSN